MEPFGIHQVADAGDMTANPFNLDTAVREVQEQARFLSAGDARLVNLGGDRTIALPVLRESLCVMAPSL